MHFGRGDKDEIITLERSIRARHAFEPMVNACVRVMGHAGSTESGWSEPTIVSRLVRSSDDTSNMLHCVKALQSAHRHSDYIPLLAIVSADTVR